MLSSVESLRSRALSALCNEDTMSLRWCTTALKGLQLASGSVHASTDSNRCRHSKSLAFRKRLHMRSLSRRRKVCECSRVSLKHVTEHLQMLASVSSDAAIPQICDKCADSFEQITIFETSDCNSENEAKRIAEHCTGRGNDTPTFSVRANRGEQHSTRSQKSSCSGSSLSSVGSERSGSDLPRSEAQVTEHIAGLTVCLANAMRESYVLKRVLRFLGEVLAESWGILLWLIPYARVICFVLCDCFLIAMDCAVTTFSRRWDLYCQRSSVNV